MMPVATTIFWLSLILIGYVYLGYPALMWIIASLKPERSMPASNKTFDVTLIISARNEQDIIAQKLDNSLAQNYPADRLEILVVSDASNDRTDEIVATYAARSVQLLRMPQQCGKTIGLNHAVSRAKGEILVFSDANAMYHEDAIRYLVAHFSDLQVGCVTGVSRYYDNPAASVRSESAYWRYEIFVKDLESRVSSTVGADGAIYALRKSLYTPMQAWDQSDFVNPLQVVKYGYRNVYEMRACSVEAAGANFEQEFARKVRVVNRAWSAMLSQKSILNPFRYGFFSVQVLSHKFLRWWVILYAATVLIANLVLFAQGPFYVSFLLIQLLFYGCAVVGSTFSSRGPQHRLFFLPYYFLMVNWAALCGIIQKSQGQTFSTWRTIREQIR